VWVEPGRMRRSIAFGNYRRGETTDKRQAKELEKDCIAAIKQGRGASKAGREFARNAFSDAAAVYLEERTAARLRADHAIRERAA
jgi:hypothetical protein